MDLEEKHVRCPAEHEIELEKAFQLRSCIQIKQVPLKSASAWPETKYLTLSAVLKRCVCRAWSIQEEQNRRNGSITPLLPNNRAAARLLIHFSPLPFSISDTRRSHIHPDRKRQIDFFFKLKGDPRCGGEGLDSANKTSHFKSLFLSVWRNRNVYHVTFRRRKKYIYI